MLVTYESINNHEISVHIHKIHRNMSTFVTSRIDSLREGLLQITYRSFSLNTHISFLLTFQQSRENYSLPFFLSILPYILKKLESAMISAQLQTSLWGCLFF